MINTVNIDLSNNSCWGTTNAAGAEENSILLCIKLLDTLLAATDIQLEFTKPDGVIVTTEVLSVNNEQINYEIPFNLYVTEGTLKLRILATNYTSDYIIFNVSADYIETDDICVKYNTTTQEFSINKCISLKSEVYPVGSVYVSNNNENPGTMLGGKWSLIDKGFRALSKELTQGEDYTINETNCDTKTEVVYTRTGNTLYVRVTLVNKVKITDTSLSMLTLNLNKIGVSQFAWSRSQILGASDGGEGIVFAGLNYKSGEFSTQDVCMNNDGVTEMETGKTTVFHITIPVIYTFMLDEACDKFYWKRTA